MAVLQRLLEVGSHQCNVTRVDVVETGEYGECLDWRFTNPTGAYFTQRTGMAVGAGKSLDKFLEGIFGDLPAGSLDTDDLVGLDVDIKIEADAEGHNRIVSVKRIEETVAS